MSGTKPPRMLIEIVTLFPEGVRMMLGESMVGRAQKFGLLELDVVQLRDFTDDRHQTVDDKPFGGEPGMVLKAEPVAATIRSLKRRRPKLKPLVVYTSPQGRRFDQELAEELAGHRRLMIICGHYKGLDQRAIDRLVDLEVSIGDFILTGGEAASVVITDAVVRLLPGVLGDSDSAVGDSFTSGLLDYPHYTQPAEWEGHKVPSVLTGGHHAKIAQWQRRQAVARTRSLRPDLYERWLSGLSEEEKKKFNL